MRESHNHMEATFVIKYAKDKNIFVFFKGIDYSLSKHLIAVVKNMFRLGLGRACLVSDFKKSVINNIKRRSNPI